MEEIPAHLREYVPGGGADAARAWSGELIRWSAVQDFKVLDSVEASVAGMNALRAEMKHGS